ncbi:RloB family protein [Bacillus mycoides]|uniref:RloB family protein n=1 Tax=Bacillus mycoides TaxID=1405 RepID=UPI0010BED83B|nr:RloB family protein [Bacillus mycoides]TKI46916.1 RloB domain-containing protein [Bacillus mycoides]
MALPKRGNKKKDIKKTIYIFCEGTETEVHYLNAIKQQMRAATVKVKVSGVGRSSEELLKYAINCTKRINDIQGTWIVYDKDAISAKDILTTESRAKKENINVAFTNCSFEVWLLLHYEALNTHSICDKKVVYRKLENHLSIDNYEAHKSDTIMLGGIAQRYRIAIENNKKLLELNSNRLTPPYSNVVELIECLA